MPLRHLRRFPQSLLALLLLACAGDPASTTGFSVASLHIAPDRATINRGDRLLLRVVATGVDGSVREDLPVAWSSVNPAVATVSSTGEVAAISAGAVTIGAAIAGVSTGSAITVLDAPVATIELFPSSVAMHVGEGRQAVLLARDAAGNPLVNRRITWQSGDPSIATVTNSGLVSGLRIGATLLTVTVDEMVATLGVTVGGVTENVRVVSMVVMQPTQNSAGTIPILQGRPSVVRVFAIANSARTAAAEVVLQVFRNGVIEQSMRGTAASLLPPGVIFGNPQLSVNFTLPASFNWSGVSLKAVADPENRISELDEYDNTWPLSLARFEPVVVSLPPLLLRLLPVTAAGVTGDVAAGDEAALLSLVRQLLPVAELSVVRHLPFRFDGSILTPAGQQDLLGQIDAVRVIEGNGGHYFGMIRAPESEWLLFNGFGYRPGFSAVGLDGLPWAANTIAHELGHNLNLQHAPCGNPLDPDPTFPYLDGGIGVPGFDADQSAFVGAMVPDFMSYCRGDDLRQWVSDFSFAKALQFRRSQAGQSVGAAPQPGILVWGTVTATGAVMVKPVFDLQAARIDPLTTERARVEGFAADGGLLLRTEISLRELGEGTALRHFAAAVPLAKPLRARLSRLVVSTPSGQGSVLRTATRGADVRSGAQFSILAGRKASVLEGNFSGMTSSLIRDERSGAVLGFGTGSSAMIAPGSKSLEIQFSNGLQTRVFHHVLP